MKSMNTPRTRAEFERSFNLLHRQMEEGKFHIAEGLSRSLDGLARVRFLPNGRIDFLSVDESARSLANSTAHFSEDFFQDQLREHKGHTNAPAEEAEEGAEPIE